MNVHLNYNINNIFDFKCLQIRQDCELGLKTKTISFFYKKLINTNKFKFTIFNWPMNIIIFCSKQEDHRYLEIL